jgi:hypothetical protein
MTACGGTGGADRARTGTASRRPAARTNPRLRTRRIGTLPAPIELPSVVALHGGGALALGGLSSSDVSTDGIVRIGDSGAARTVGRLPSPLHDSAATAIAGRPYMLGGGDATPTAAILRLTRDGRSASAGRLPAAASDVAAATVGSTAYVIGGYTGTRPLRTLLAYTPGHPIRTAATLPRPLRYAAVAAVDGDILIAGGTSGGFARREVLRYRPGTNRVVPVARLSRPLTHAAGAVYAGRFYVIGGRGDTLDSASRAIWSIDPGTWTVRAAGRLPAAFSDLGVASGPRDVLLVGGRDARGGVSDQILRAEVAP